MRHSASHRIACLALVVAACADDGETGAPASSKRHDESFESEGYRWVKTRDVVYEDPSESERPTKGTAGSRAPTPQGPDVRAMSMEEVIAKLSPIMEFQGKEYRLDEASQHKFAVTLKAAAEQEARAHDAARPQDAELAPARSDSVDKKVFTPDGRTMVSNPSGSTPYKWIGVYGTTTRSGGTIFKAYNDYTGVTVAHAMYNGQTSTWIARQDIRFGHSAASPPANGWVGTSCWVRQVPAGWDGVDHAYDFAIIAFRGRGATCAASTYQVGYFVPQTVSSGVSGIAGIVSGYPDKPNAEAPAGGWTVPELFTHQDSGGHTSTWPAYPTQIWHFNDTSDGQSGAPYWTNVSGTIRVRGIHWGYDPGIFTPSNAARRWDSTIDSYCAAYGGL